MEDTTNVVDGYTLGGLGMAVPTSLIFEYWAEKGSKAGALLAKHAPNINQIRINVHTLVRNISESLEDEVKTVDAILEHFIEELPLLESAFQDYLPDREIIFYVTELSYYPKVIPRTTFKVSKSERVRSIAKLERTAVKECFEFLEGLETFPVERVTVKSGTITKRALVLTHLPADLLCYQYYASMLLLESHTGNIRERSTFVHKILSPARRENAQYIPFNQLSFYVYGDGGKLLQPAPPSVTTRYTKLAIDNKWRTGTTKDKIIDAINKSKDKVLIDYFSR